MENVEKKGALCIVLFVRVTILFTLLTCICFCLCVFPDSRYGGLHDEEALRSSFVPVVG